MTVIMRKILVFKIPAKLVLEAAGRKIEEEKKSFESRVTSSTKLYIPSTIKNLIESDTFLILADWAIKIG